ncbi:MAG: hypothetical protein LKJ51_07115 [Limosilactobacillus sp.]|uniref:hypothetical protein n=1 Tax=Limosilactobacillus sp. TaxID=2773925 RepID=UPI0025C4E93F|nr:hypothetical protein [Limosilactobacillus sp.]MCI1975670.1 hypothetical protein [Limosilactobacillus sp.]MCI2031428.1 hypothetical protein [Limosilactobacillus sp.]
MDKDPQSSNNERMTRQQYRQQQARPDETEEPRQPFSESRAAQKIEEEQLTSEQKMNRLRKRLNIAIISLVVAIVIVYLILFFVK